MVGRPGRKAGMQACRLIGKHADRPFGTWTINQADGRPINRMSDRRTYRQTDRVGKNKRQRHPVSWG